MKKHLKKIKTDKSAAKLLEQDLSPYIHSENFKPMQFELKPKNQTVTVRISEDLLRAVKLKAKKNKVFIIKNSYDKLSRSPFNPPPSEDHKVKVSKYYLL